MKKRLIAVLLTAALVLGMSINVSAIPEDPPWFRPRAFCPTDPPELPETEELVYRKYGA